MSPAERYVNLEREPRDARSTSFGDTGCVDQGVWKSRKHGQGERTPSKPRGNVLKRSRKEAP